MNKSYKELLKDPRWQKKRLEILNRDRWQCMACWDTETPLNVHHIEYNKGKKPWEYDDGDLITLCDDCHTELHNEPNIELGDATISYPADHPSLIKIKNGKMMVMIYDSPYSKGFNVYIATYIDKKKVSMVIYNSGDINTNRVVR